jgi:small subunit ribosomal protein S17
MPDHSTSPKIQAVTGTITKLCSQNTIKVSTKVTKIHPIYRKRYTLARHYLAHNSNLEAKIGDIVTIVTCRPISKLKHWTVLEK